MFYTGGEDFVKRFEASSREKIMEDILELRMTKNSRATVFESMVYARTVENKEHSYEVCPQENFTDKIFNSIFVFMLQHYCRYDRENL